MSAVDPPPSPWGEWFKCERRIKPKRGAGGENTRGFFDFRRTIPTPSRFAIFASSALTGFELAPQSLAAILATSPTAGMPLATQKSLSYC